MPNRLELRDNISLGLQQVLFPFPGAVTKLNASPMKFIPLANTGEKPGTVRGCGSHANVAFGASRELNEDRRQTSTFESIRWPRKSKAKSQPTAGDEQAEKKPIVQAGRSEDGEKSARRKNRPDREVDLHVVLVADIDMLSDAFFRLREMGESQENDINFQFDNVTFVLNVLDKLAGDERFIDIRKRRPHASHADAHRRRNSSRSG